MAKSKLLTREDFKSARMAYGLARNEMNEQAEGCLLSVLATREEALMTQMAELRQETVCDGCLGSALDIRCGCGGSGLLADMLCTVRKVLHAREVWKAKALKVLKGVDEHLAHTVIMTDGQSNILRTSRS